MASRLLSDRIGSYLLRFDPAIQNRLAEAIIRNKLKATNDFDRTFLNQYALNPSDTLPPLRLNLLNTKLF